MSIYDKKTNATIQLTSITPTALTFIALPSPDLLTRGLVLRINNATHKLTVNYTDLANPKVTGISGGYPTVAGHLQLPSSAAALLMLIGSGFGAGISASVSPQPHRDKI